MTAGFLRCQRHVRDVGVTSLLPYNQRRIENHEKTGTDLNFSVEVKKLFNEVTAQYPKRKTVSFHLGMTEDDNDLISILIKNGANENESAVLTLTEPYVYEFYFNGGN